MLSTTSIKAYIAELVSAFRKIELMDFLHELHTRFNPGQDLSFMDYFLELCSEENEGQFVVPHEKLIEFKVATSNESSKIKQRIGRLGLIEGADYLLARTCEQSETSRGVKHKNTYFLTPEAFKLCLMRAKKEKSQEIDVQMYAKYFLFVEKVVKYYSDYQRDLEHAISLNKDGQIEGLRSDILNAQEAHREELSDTIRQMAEAAEAQRTEFAATANKQRAEILQETKDAKDEVKKAREDISDMYFTSFPTMIASTTIKAYIAELVAAYRKIELMGFLNEIHARFNPEQDLSFMEYFLELCSEENEGQFIVHHEKLIEFKIATSTESVAIKRRIERLQLIEGKEYVSDHVVGNPLKGGRPKNTYFLTPEAFKLCLMRAQKRSNQDVDVQMYAKYFLFVEKVVKYYSDYQRDLEHAISLNKDGQIEGLRADILNAQQESVAMQELHQQQLSDTIRQMAKAAEAQRTEFAATANKQRAEILQETKDAKDEVKKAREDISDLHETVIDHAESAMHSAQHASVDVKPAKRQYFAMTACRRIGDTSDRLYFTCWRRQAAKMTSLLMDAMTNPLTDKDSNEYTAHHLVIPPIYFPGAINLGNAGKTNLDVFVKNKIAELNRGRKRADKLKIKEFKDTIGLTSSSLHPIWSPNEHMSHCEFVDCFLDIIKDTKVIKLSVDEPKLQKQLDVKERERFQELINATGMAREDLEKMIEKVRSEMETPPPSDDEGTTDTE